MNFFDTIGPGEPLLLTRGVRARGRDSGPRGRPESERAGETIGVERRRWVGFVRAGRSGDRCGARALAALIGLGLGLGLGLTSGAASGALHGDLLGVSEGNDSEDSIRLDLGLEVVRLDRVEPADRRSSGLELSTLVRKDGDEPIAGAWRYAGPTAVDLIAVKAGNAYAVYRYERAPRDAVAGFGSWDTSRLGNRELSHLTAYRVVPEPSTAVLLGLGIASLCGGLRARARRADGHRRDRPGSARERRRVGCGPASVARQRARLASRLPPAGIARR